MDNDFLLAIFFIGLACIFIPVVIVAITFLGGASWETVGQEVALGILAVFIMGIAFLFLASPMRR